MASLVYSLDFLNSAKLIGEKFIDRLPIDSEFKFQSRELVKQLVLTNGQDKFLFMLSCKFLRNFLTRS